MKKIFRKFFRNFSIEKFAIVMFVLTAAFLLWVNTVSYSNISNTRITEQLQGFGYSNIQLGTMKHEFGAFGRCERSGIASIDFIAYSPSNQKIDDVYACIGITWKKNGVSPISLFHK